MPANEFYDSSGTPSSNTLASSAAIRAEFNLIETGFNKLPTMAGNANELVVVDSSGTALTTSPIATVAATALALKADLASPTFTGTVTIPTPFTLGAVSVLPTGTELNFIDGVTSNIQTQLDAKSPLASPTFTGTVTTDVLTTTGQFNLTGDLIKTRSESGADSLISMTNSSNTANSGVNFVASVAGTSAGDAWSSYSVTGTAAWSVGLDNSDSDKFKISNFLSLGTSDALTITPSTLLTTLAGGLSFSSSASPGVSGSVWSGATYGLIARGYTGAVSDFAIMDQTGGTPILSNTTGTLHINIGGSFGRGAPVTKTADFTVGASENWLINNKAAATCTVALPAAASYTGREIEINNYQAFTVVSASSNVVPLAGGAASTAILAATAGKWATLVSNGTNWVISRSN